MGSEEWGVTWQVQLGGTWAGTGREGRAQLYNNPSQEVPLVDQNYNKGLNQFSHQVIATLSELLKF